MSKSSPPCWKKSADSSAHTPQPFWLLTPDFLDSHIPQGYQGRSPWLVSARDRGGDAAGTAGRLRMAMNIVDRDDQRVHRHFRTMKLPRFLLVFGLSSGLIAS